MTPTYVVVGMPRTGTSLMMNVLVELGLPFVGDVKPGYKMNPKGFYESTRHLIEGLSDEGFSGKVIKLFIVGFLRTTIENYRGIVCVRNPDDQRLSWKNSRHENFKVNPETYTRQYSSLMKKMDERLCVVDYDCLLGAPDVQLRRICTHLGLPFKKVQCIDPSLHRTHAEKTAGAYQQVYQEMIRRA